MTDRRDQRPEDVDEPAEPARSAAQEGVRILGAEEAAAALEGGQVARRLDDDAPRFGDVPPRPDPAVRPAARFPRPGGEPASDPTLATAPDDEDAPRPRVSSPPRGTAADTKIAAAGSKSASAATRAAAGLEGGALGLDVDLDAGSHAGSGEAASASRGHDDHDDHDDADEIDIVIDVSDDAALESSTSVPLPHWTEPPTGEVPIILPEAEVVDDDVEPEGDGDLEAWRSTTGDAPRFRSGAGDWAEADFAGGLEEDALGLGALSGSVTDDDDAFDSEVAQRRRRRLRVRGRDPAASGSEAGATAPETAPAPGAGRGSIPGPTRAPHPEGEPPTDAPGSDLTTRVVTGVAIAVASLVCLRLGRGATAVLAAVVIGVATFELFETLRKRGFHPATILGVLAAATTPLAAYRVGEAAFPLMLALVTVFSLLWYLFDVVEARAVVNVAVTLLGYVYVGALGGFAGLLLAYPDGVGLILGVVLCVVAYDVFGYLVGSQFGKTPLLQRISPNKTLEGLLAGMTASILVSALIVNRITPWTDLGHALSLGVLVAVVAPLGDLCESLLKRDLKIKDFGTILPGHGGVLDRFDALLFCLPAVYYLARYLKIG